MPAQTLDDAALGRLAQTHLERVVAIDSASDEHSQTVPTTPGQTVLADDLAGFFGALGAEVARDAFANVIARLPGRGAGVGQTPVALMVHLDTAPGTAPTPKLNLAEAWTGDRVPYPANAGLQVTTANYPTLKAYLGHDLVFGPGDVPFGLDDKLGLTHLMTLAWLLNADPAAEHPPVWIIGRPDEEVGRSEALFGLAEQLAAAGVTAAYTIDGLLPFEINVENFNGAGATVHFDSAAFDLPPFAEWSAAAPQVALFLGGVNTHGATARVEGHRPATRLAAEILDRLVSAGLAPDHIVPVAFASVAARDCDAHATFALRPDGDGSALRDRLLAIVAEVFAEHLPRGASWRIEGETMGGPAAHPALFAALRHIHTFLQSEGVSPIAAEDSDDREGYSQPYRLRPSEPAAGEPEGWCLHVRLRDFDTEGLEARKRHVAGTAPAGTRVNTFDQYGNMAPRLAAHPELVTWAKAAAEAVGVDAPIRPIRGGTGVDPFLDKGVPVANLGTGYFAPESEKEFTSRNLMAQHARWLMALLATIAQARSAR